MKKITFLFLLIIFAFVQVKASDFIPIKKKKTEILPVQTNKVSPELREIAILDGTVVLEVSKGVEFPCIGLRLYDNNINRQLGTYLEIKKRGKYYLIENKKYINMNDGIEIYLKDLFEGFYDDKKYGRKVWSAFVEEGGLQLFIEIANDIIDDEFLNSPLNDTYG